MSRRPTSLTAAALAGAMLLTCLAAPACRSPEERAMDRMERDLDRQMKAQVRMMKQMEKTMEEAERDMERGD